MPSQAEKQGTSNNKMITGILIKLVESLNRLDRDEIMKDWKAVEKYITKNNDELDFHTFDAAMYRSSIKKLKELGIPVYSAEVIGSNEKILVTPRNFRQEVESILNAIRYNYGHHISDMKELRDVAKINDPEAKIYKISGLTKEEAFLLAEKVGKDFSFVKERNNTKEPPTYTVAVLNKDRVKLNKLLFQAKWELNGTIGEKETKRVNHLATEESQIEDALEKVNGCMDQAYIFSPENPDFYIRIDGHSFTLYKNGEITSSDAQERCEDEYDYAEKLKFNISKIENPVYVLPEFIATHGGIGSDELAQAIKAQRPSLILTPEEEKKVAAEAELCQWLSNKINFATVVSFKKLPDALSEIDLNAFQREFLKECKEKGLEEYYQEVIDNSDNFRECMSKVAATTYSLDCEYEVVKRTINEVIQEMDNKETNRERTENIDYERN